MNHIWREIWNTSLGLDPDAEIVTGTIPHETGIIEPIEDDTNANEIRNEILIISLGGSISLAEEKQEKSVDRRALKSIAITSPPPAKATATVVPPTSMAHIRHYLRKEDIERLQSHQWLNDDLISFGIRMMEHKFTIKHGVIAFNTYFLEKIQRDGLYAIGKWHARINDPFSKDMLFFPIHSNGNHWYLQVVIIHHPPMSSGEQTASLFILDSLGYNANHKIHVDFILSYLRFYWPHLKDIGVQSSKVPQQTNFSDCGIYVIYFCKVLCMRNLQLSLRVMKGDRNLNAEDITTYWDITEVSQIRSWLLHRFQNFSLCALVCDINPNIPRATSKERQKPSTITHPIHINQNTRNSNVYPTGPTHQTDDPAQAPPILPGISNNSFHEGSIHYLFIKLGNRDRSSGIAVSRGCGITENYNLSSKSNSIQDFVIYMMKI